MKSAPLPDVNQDRTGQHCESLPTFLPPLLLRNCHVQTLTGAYLFGRWAGRFADPATQAVQGQVQLDDGDRLVYHDNCPADWKPGDRVVVLLHGLSGSYASPYMVRTAGRLNRLNVRVFRIDWRGSGAGISLARFPYHSGRSDDLRAALNTIHRLCADSPISLVGFSMGGNVTLKFLGEVGPAASRQYSVCSAISICPPIDLSRTIKSIQTGAARLYNEYFARACVRDVRHRKGLFPDAVVPDGWFEKPPREMWEFDDTFTAPVCGFASAEDYYQKSSAKGFLSKIAVPTLMIASQDDPLIPFGQFEEAVYSNPVVLRAPRHGGHVGFVTMRGPDWLDQQILNWILQGV